MSDCQYRECDNSLIGIHRKGGRQRIYCSKKCRELETAARRSDSSGTGGITKPEVQQEKQYQKDKKYHLYWLTKPLGEVNA